MRKSLLQIYCLLVCIFTVACFSITLGLCLQNSVKLIWPQLIVEPPEGKIYKDKMQDQNLQEIAKKIAKLPPGVTYEQAQKVWDANYQRSVIEYEDKLAKERREALRAVINYLIIILVDIFIFVPHWRLAKRQADV